MYIVDPDQTKNSCVIGFNPYFNVLIAINCKLLEIPYLVVT